MTRKYSTVRTNRREVAYEELGSQNAVYAKNYLRLVSRVEGHHCNAIDKARA